MSNLSQFFGGGGIKQIIRGVINVEATKSTSYVVGDYAATITIPPVDINKAIILTDQMGAFRATNPNETSIKQNVLRYYTNSSIMQSKVIAEFINSTSVRFISGDMYMGGFYTIVEFN